jgi:hypothetical protein
MIRIAFFPNFLLTALVVLVTDAVAVSQDRSNPPPLLPAIPPADAPKKIEPAPIDFSPAPISFSTVGQTPVRFFDFSGSSNGFLKGNQNFQNFIGFISNPAQSIDPRSSTELVAIFGSAWITANDVTLPNGRTIDRSLLPSGNMQVYGGGPMAIAITDRLCVGLNDGGYAVARFDSDRQQILRRLGLPVPDVDRSGLREGWLNFGGYAQYTLIADVQRQFLLTAGLRWEAPAGATQIFQGGANPAYLAPYVTIGKEFGCYHVLATTGYEFAAGSGDATTSTAYLNLHFDRKIGWLYPLIELNGSYHTSSTDVSITSPHHGVIDLGTFSSTGNTLIGAVGATAVLVPGKLELGAVYTRPVSAQNHFDYNGVLVRMTWRY